MENPLGIMMTKLTFYTNPMSRGRIARWMLEETGAVKLFCCTTGQKCSQTTTKPSIP